MANVETHHIGIVVTDLEEAVSFYRETLDFDVVDEFTLAGNGIATAIGVEDVTGRFVHLDAGSARVELIEYDPTGDDAGAEAINQVGATHVGFTVEDIEAFYEALPADVDPLSEPQRIELGIEVLFFRDPDGNFVEIVEG